jgi:lysophospholipase L1-like esterase
MPIDGEETGEEGSPGGSESAQPVMSPSPAASTQPSKSKPQPAITAIGDSVMLDIQPYVENDIAGIVVDGKIGRQMADAAKTIDKLKQEGQLGHTVILELGTNGPFTRKQMERMLAELDEAKNIVLVNTRVPRTWERTVNKALKNAAAEDSRITLVDWHGESAGKSNYFAEDGVHLTAAGAKAYASLLKQTLKGL